jgi:apolipoprotein N-acyltransferase
MNNSTHFGFNFWSLIVVATLSGILTGLACNKIIWFLGLTGFVPVFYYYLKQNPNLKKIVATSIITSFFMSLFIYGWVFGVVSNYTGGSYYLGIVVWLIMFLINSLKIIFLFSIFVRYVRFDRKKQPHILLVTVFAASLFVATDFVLEFLMRGFPWAYFFVGYSQAVNLYFIQIAEFGGVGILTWAVIAINVLIAFSITNKSLKPSIYAFTMVGIIHLYGWIRVETSENVSKEKVKLALICDNSPTQLRWNEKRLNEYVNRLFELNRKALLTRPDIIVWNESVIPWTFNEDDDFFKAIIKQSEGTGASHLISYFTADTSNPGYSSVSAYLIDESGKVTGRYDKSELLAGVEKPLLSFLNTSLFQLPFFNQNAGGENIENTDPRPIESKFGKIGIMICNESLQDATAKILRERGAEYLILLSNDNWFANTALTRFHFYFTRIRAIENRLDIAINANLGISGLIDSKGRIVKTSNTNAPEILTIDIGKRNPRFDSALIQKLFQIITFILLILTVLKRSKYEKF